MINLVFADNAPQELVLAQESEVYTSCPMSTLDKKLCDVNWHSNYAQLQTTGFVVLPAGTYRITPLLNKACATGDCWVCAVPLEQCEPLEERGILPTWA